MPWVDQETLDSAVIILDWLGSEKVNNLLNDADKLMIQEAASIRRKLYEASRWKSFWLDTNKYEGNVDSPEKWAFILTLYDFDEIKKARRRDVIDAVFGFRAEFKGETLEEYFNQYEIPIESIK